MAQTTFSGPVRSLGGFISAGSTSFVSLTADTTITVAAHAGKVLLCNTVHDCVWLDSDGTNLDIAIPDVVKIMEGVPEFLEELYGMEVPVPFPVEAEVGNDMFNMNGFH